MYTNNLSFVSRLNSFLRLIERPYTPELRSPNTRRHGVTSFSLFYTNPICRLQISQTYKHTLTHTSLTSPPPFKRALPLEPKNLNSMHSGGFLKFLSYENLLGHKSLFFLADIFWSVLNMGVPRKNLNRKPPLFCYF